MKIICPKCGETIDVEESDGLSSLYADIEGLAEALRESGYDFATREGGENG